MAKRRTRRFRRKSGRWAPNIVKISNQIVASPGEFAATEDLAVNPLQQNTGVSQTFTAKNFEITFTIEVPTSYIDYQANALIEAVTAYIMFVPQGMQVTSSYYAEHPEYILAYKYLGSPSGIHHYPIGESSSYTELQQYQPYRIKTRLSRKLQTGDKIILYIQGSNESSSNKQFTIAGLVRWWSKAN